MSSEMPDEIWAERYERGMPGSGRWTSMPRDPNLLTRYIRRGLDSEKRRAMLNDVAALTRGFNDGTFKINETFADRDVLMNSLSKLESFLREGAAE